MTGQFGVRFDRRDGVNMVELMERVEESNGHVYYRKIGEMTKNQFIDWILAPGVFGMTDFK